jgi:hypothetical protein
LFRSGDEAHLQIDPDIAELYDAIRIDSRLALVPQRRPHARQQLTDAERLG